MMVGSHSYCYFFSLISLLLCIVASPTLHHCHDDQRDALLEFKGEFPTTPYNSEVIDTSLSSWNKSSDCCSWDRVMCDAKSGKVISLYLPYVYLNNSLKTNSSLFKLQHLRELSLSRCKLYGEIPLSLGNLSHLTYLDLSDNKLVGQLRDSVGNLTQLENLDFSENNFSGMLPRDMSGSHNLISLDVRDNSFSGPFPTSLFRIPSLESVYLENNQFKGPVEFGNASSMSRLFRLLLGHNQFNGRIPESICEFPILGYLDLLHNNFIGSIPRCISKMDGLTEIDFSNNRLEGEIPGFLGRLESVTLSHNSFSSFGKSWEVVDEFTLMFILDLSSNSLRGQIPNWICKISFLRLLDLSNNSFNGLIPSCLKKNTQHLQALILRNNGLSGILPDIFVNATELKSVDVSHNQLEGKFPKSLMSCDYLEYLNVERNKMKDKFPSWLNSLPHLSVLSLRSNEFYGPLYHPNVSIGFQSLKVIDISLNGFTGTFPPFYFQNWRNMIRTSVVEDNYVESEPYMDVQFDFSSYSNSMEMVHKGTYRKFERIRVDFRAIDFSGNRFCGNIPASIGLLKQLRLLNLSGNAFTSSIPQSLANLTKLEELDLSQNQLSGQIPQDLGNLNFLSTMNFSHNNLEGPVPRSTQFQSQNCSSFMGNSKLYGLEEMCGKIHVPNPQEPDELSKREELEINWIAAAIAFGPGVFCGLVIGYIFVSHKNQWFMEKFHQYKPRVVTIIGR